MKAVGGRSSKARTAHQTLMAKYRINVDMLPALRLVSDQEGRKLVDNARLFALYKMIDDDVMLASGEAESNGPIPPKSWISLFASGLVWTRGMVSARRYSTSS